MSDFCWAPGRKAVAKTFRPVCPPTRLLEPLTYSVKFGLRLVHHDCPALHHRLKCVPSMGYRLTTFYLTRGLLLWYTFGCSKVRPGVTEGAFFFV
jgi:hypothetical protein